MITQQHVKTLTRMLAKIAANATDEDRLFVEDAQQAVRAVRSIRVCRVCRGTGKVVAKPYLKNPEVCDCYNCRPIKL